MENSKGNLYVVEDFNARLGNIYTEMSNTKQVRKRRRSIQFSKLN